MSTAVRQADLGERLAQEALKLEERGRLDAAIDCWQRAIAIAPRRAEYHHTLGDVLRLRNRLPEAINAYRGAIEIKPTLAASWCNLCAALRIAGQTDEAIECGNRAVSLDPSLAEAHNNLAAALLDRAEFRRALAACHVAMQLNPGMAEAHRIAAQALLPAGESEMALTHLQFAAKLAPSSAESFVELGDAWRNASMLDDARKAYVHAALVDPRCADAVVGQIRLQVIRGEFDDALSSSVSAAARFPGNIAVAITLADLLGHFKRHADVVSTLRPQLERTDLTIPQRRCVHFALGDALDRLGDYGAAWASYCAGNGLKGARFDRAAAKAHADALIQAFGSEVLTRITSAENPPVTPIFIAGFPRSGTTLTEQILASHPNAFGAGELSLIGRAIARMGPMLGTSQPYPACVAALTPAKVQTLAAFCLDEFAKLTTGHSHIIEKTPNNVLHVGLIRTLLPAARIVHCRRDPLDTCLSCYFHDFTGHHPYAYDLADLGFAYRLQDRLMRQWVSVGVEVLTIEYEHMVANQQSVSAALLDFCGLGWNESCAAFHANTRVVHTASRDQVRRPMYTTSVARHKNYDRYLGPLRGELDAEG